MNLTLPISVESRVIISEYVNDPADATVIHDTKNAIHSQNMARAIARGLAREPHHFIYRLALGRGGTAVDGIGNILFNPPNDGREGSGGWAATLYNETYSEIVDELDVNFGQDPGSAGRLSGGANPLDDPAGGGVVSYEAGLKSVIKIVMHLNQSEPMGQLDNEGGPLLEEDEKCFYFNELGFYTSGLPGVATNGSASIDVGDKTSNDLTTLVANTTYTMVLTIDGVVKTLTIQTPGGGSGPLGQFTYGDLCEGINNATWIATGDDLSSILRVSITDRSGGTYPSIISAQTFGYLTFTSLTAGVGSAVELQCVSGQTSNIFNVLASGLCENVGVNTQIGKPAGVQNDPIAPENERERLLTHLIFSPVLKHANRQILLEYFLTVSVPATSDSTTSQITG